ncbi:MAG: rhodanese-like domain-containing protein, partial [Ruminococcus sp.]
MKKKMLSAALLSLIIFASCGNNNTDENNTGDKEYMNITAEEAKEIMDNEEDYIILDVRTQEEYDEGHIPG